ncbi:MULTISPECIES: hypothetical protein [unclassified Sphingobium]|uniref:hypothetical protein n=1 Tax=unclassified Sphingobium TaxID=2611147 RepID=UPI002224BB63|nr:MULTISPECIES: hypothetical protein [unclassified Sphingobium]MCW2395889.1 hypothetical protein [Sphingobium sp. B8D3B]MCW2419405.1 hypothetical protein [Sphingobium sp. B8D3C]
MATNKTRPAFIARSFTDNGTMRTYAAGTIHEIDEGAFANYEHAGLIRYPTAEDKRTAKAAQEPETPAS